MKTLVEKIENVLNAQLPEGAHRIIKEVEGSFGGDYIKIAFAASDAQINNVRGQHPQCVSLCLDIQDMELYPQVFGGNGGRLIHRKPNMEDPREKYLAMKGVRIPFRKPKPEEAKILNAIARFAQRWQEALKQNREVLMYQDLVNYDELLK